MVITLTRSVTAATPKTANAQSKLDSTINIPRYGDNNILEIHKKLGIVYTFSF